MIVTPPLPYIKRGDLKPDLVYYARDDAHEANLAEVVSWRLIARLNGSPLFVDEDPEVDMPNPAEPWQVTLTHLWLPAETITEGRVYVEAEATWPGNKPQTFPTVRIDVLEDLG